ncbi:MAG: hypothetical protein IKV96_02610 [Firmicutes bacterium]|nr:hypothetical protein [Bacillota bacterium]
MSGTNLIRKAAADFAVATLAPVSYIPEKTAEYTYDAVKEMTAMGFLKAANLEEASIIVEEFAKQNASMAEVVAVANVTADVLAAYSVDAKGMTGYAVYEEGVSCGGVIATEVEGGYTITGKKIAAALGGAADQYIVIATLGDSLAAFLVEAADVESEKFDKLGLRSYPTADLTMENAPAVLISVNGAKVRAEVAAKIDILNCFVAAGLADACVKASINHAKTRVQFGMPIAKQTAVQYMLAEIEIARFNLLAVGEKALAVATTGKSCIVEAAAAKKIAEKAVYSAATNAVQIHGGTGYSRDYPIERYYREAKTLFTYTEKADYPEESVLEALLK